MAKPSDKADGMEQALTEMFGFDRSKVIESNMCVPKPWGCGGSATEFTDELSQREYTISGLCQTCQDSLFGSGDE